ncbi:macro domain-containing protein [Moniliophthora roreri MCA 2997]|uniref:Macro domain-containing protein n=1 Tax=Moniliophthora roreri (strain MCA 2997) TaxID=1381753 RepID=V2XAS9_MONRO|nr:macro domain-containing protein [Moniliophthora roreri MCA 2997]
MSSSASNPEQEMPKIIKLSHIRTLSQLYKTAILKPASTATYTPNVAFLDRISLFQGDITKLEVDSIVNAANESLLGGGGVDGAIHRAAGPQLLEECRGLNGADTGEAKITKAYKLPSRHVIHTVGPIYNDSDIDLKAKQLASCYKSSLILAVENACKHIAFPSISTGIYGYPITDATHIALRQVREFYETEEGDKLDRVIFVVFSDKDKDVYENLIPEYFPPPPEFFTAPVEG